MSTSSYSWGNIPKIHIWETKTSNSLRSSHQRPDTVKEMDVRALIRTFLWHTEIPGIVSLLRCLIADCVATLGPPQDTESPVQPPEGAAPHWRTVKISDCKEKEENGPFINYLTFNMPRHVWVWLFTANPKLPQKKSVFTCCNSHWWKAEILCTSIYFQTQFESTNVFKSDTPKHYLSVTQYDILCKVFVKQFPLVCDDS